ncbi:MAG: transposase [Alphaproteobacteria bacterium]|nr:transposase [Alphaproteobacteria bacterium]
MAKHKTPQQIVAALHKVDLAIAQGATASTAVRTAGISIAAYYRWRAEYGGMTADQVQRVMQLKKDNLRLQDRVDKLSRLIVWTPEMSAGGTEDGGGPTSPAQRAVSRRSARGKPAKP